MPKYKILILKNSMFAANLLAMGFGSLLLFIIYEFILRGYQSDAYISFHQKTANIIGAPIFAVVYLVIFIYELPIRRYFNQLGKQTSNQAGIPALAAKRLLNAPFFIVAMDMVAWFASSLTFAWFEFRFGLTWQQISMNRIDAMFTGLIATTLAFFLLERLLQSYLTPLAFPRGKLHDVSGTWRINLAVRLFAVFVAINLIPFLAILMSLYRITISQRDPSDSLQMMTTGLWIITPIAIAVGIGLVAMLSLNLKRSLDSMVVVLRKIKSGRFTSNVTVTSNDEIGYVGEAINEMAGGLIERDRMRQSLDLAGEVQQNLLPKENLTINGFEIAGKSIYCDETGGDYYDFIVSGANDDQRVRVAVGDVSGHGIPSALLMAAVRSSLRLRSAMPGGPAEIMSSINRQLVYDVEDSGQFMTMFYLTIEPPTRRLCWVRAGHDPAILYDPTGDAFEELGGAGLALGVDADWRFEESAKTNLSRGQVIILSTDGIWEARNRQGKMYGKEPVYDIIRQNPSLSAVELLDTMLRALARFQNGARIDDDITMVVIKIIS